MFPFFALIHICNGSPEIKPRLKEIIPPTQVLCETVLSNSNIIKMKSGFNDQLVTQIENELGPSDQYKVRDSLFVADKWKNRVIIPAKLFQRNFILSIGSAPAPATRSLPDFPPSWSFFSDPANLFVLRTF